MARKLTPDAVMARVDDIMSARWSWGQADCCTSACAVFEALHGVNPMAPVADRYRCARSAGRLIRSYGGFIEMARSLAARAGLGDGEGATGEIGLSHAGAAEGPEGRAMMICIRPGAWAGKSALGYTILKRAEYSWRA